MALRPQLALVTKSHEPQSAGWRTLMKPSCPGGRARGGGSRSLQEQFALCLRTRNRGQELGWGRHATRRICSLLRNPLFLLQYNDADLFIFIEEGAYRNDESTILFQVKHGPWTSPEVADARLLGGAGELVSSYQTGG